MRKQEFDDEVVLDYDRVQDKFQLPALNDLFTRVNQHLKLAHNESLPDFELNPIGLAHGYLVRSGRKILTDYFIQLPDWTGPWSNEDVVGVLYLILSNTFFRKWEQLRDAFFIEYVPLQGINYTETREGSHMGTENSSGNATTSIEKSGTITHGEQVASQSSLVHGETVTDNATVTHGKTVTENGMITYGHGITDVTTELPGQTTSTTATSSGAENVYGFNSSAAVPNSTDSASSTETVTTSGTNRSEVNHINEGHDDTESTITEGGTTGDTRSILHGGTDTTNASVTHSGTDTTGSESSQTETTSQENSTTGTDSVEIVRKGRFGQTPQQLLEEEVRARKNNLVNIMYQDIDSVITIKVY